LEAVSNCRSTNPTLGDNFLIAFRSEGHIGITKAQLPKSIPGGAMETKDLSYVMAMNLATPEN